MLSLEILGRRGATLADPLNVLCISTHTLGCARQCVYDSAIIPLRAFVLVIVYTHTHTKHTTEFPNPRALSCGCMHMKSSIRWLNYWLLTHTTLFQKF